MPIYEYEHKATGQRVQVTNSVDKQHMDELVAQKLYRRKFSFKFGTPYSAINPHDPRRPPIGSRIRHKDELKRLSEEHSTRFGGMDVDYQPVDISDPREVGVSESGVEAHERRRSQSP